MSALLRSVGLIIASIGIGGAIGYSGVAYGNLRAREEYQKIIEESDAVRRKIDVWTDRTIEQIKSIENSNDGLSRAIDQIVKKNEPRNSAE